MTDEIKTVDFDAFRREQAGAPVKFLIDGEVYDLSPSLPAAVAVDIIRLKAKVGDNGQVPLEMLDGFGRSIFGSDLWGEVLDKHRITVNEIPQLLEKVLEVYSEPAPKAPEIPTSEETSEPSSASSTTGPGSSPTSSESTPST